MGMGSVGGSQIIGGQSYDMYSPQWYAAQDKNKIHNAQVNGAANAAELGGALGGLPASLKALMDGSGGGNSGVSGASSPVSPFDPGNLSASSVAHAKPVDTTAAHAAAFGAAKDEAANTARASLDALTGELSSRGMGGAGYEAGQIGRTLSREANTIGAASRSEATSEAGLREREGARNYEGDITQRGQDIGANEASAGLKLGARGQDVTMRGQDLSAAAAARQEQLARLSLVLKSLGGGSGNLY